MIQFFERIPGYVYDLAVYGGIVVLVLVMAYLSPSVHAAPLAKQQEAGLYACRQGRQLDSKPLFRRLRA
jgi:hypothetical protein